MVLRDLGGLLTSWTSSLMRRVGCGQEWNAARI